MSADSQSNIQPGALLRQARDRAGMSLSDIAKQTRILLPRLEALENNDYASAGGSATFIVGYIRAYARVVDAQPGPILKAFEADYSVSVEAPVPAEQVYVPMENSTRSGFPIKTIAIVLVVIALVVVLAQMLNTSDVTTSPVNSSSTTTILEPDHQQEPELQKTKDLLLEDIVKDREPVPSKKQLVSEPDRADNKTESSNVLDEDIELEQIAPLERRPRSDDLGASKKQHQPSQYMTAEKKLSRAPVDVANTVQAPGTREDVYVEAARKTGLDSLTMKFSDQCWVRVHDNTGKRVVYRLAKAGDEIKVRGQAPFDMLLGNAEAVSVHVNNRLINTEPAIGSRKLRKKVGP